MKRFGLISIITMVMTSFLFFFLLTGSAYSDVHKGYDTMTFDGESQYVQIPDNNQYSVTNTGEMTVSFWMRPDTLNFDKDISSGYVNFLGKGVSGAHEWTFRMYSQDNTEGRDNRISFYVFNPDGGLGAGSYFQVPITAGDWIYVTAKVDKNKVYIYMNGKLMDSDYYYTSPYWIIPKNTDSPLRIGSRSLKSFFKGAISDVSIFNKALSDSEIKQIYDGGRFSFDLRYDHGDYHSSKNLVGWFKLNDLSSNVVKDYSHTKNYGIFNS